MSVTEATATAKTDAPAAGSDVELISVTRSFTGVIAVDDVSLDIKSGEFFSLLGPSGCGKTTTLRMIGGFEMPSAGDIRIKGRSVTALPPNRRPTNMVFQQLALFPHLTVFENVAFGLRLAKVEETAIKRRVGDALALVSLDGLAGRMANQLSGGQQQRVALARALVNEPAVLLLDEPFAALDLKLRTQMQGELKSIQQRLGTTFVFVTHDQGEAFSMSDRLALMNGGRVEQLGSPREIYDRPSTRFVATFVGETNLFDARVAAVDGAEARAEADGLSFRIASGQIASGGLSAGDAVSISLRPERIAVSAERGDHAATITDVTFQGAAFRLKLALEGGRTLNAVAVNDGSMAVAVGGACRVSWSPSDLVVLTS